MRTNQVLLIDPGQGGADIALADIAHESIGIGRGIETVGRRTGADAYPEASATFGFGPRGAREHAVSDSERQSGSRSQLNETPAAHPARAGEACHCLEVHRILGPCTITCSWRDEARLLRTAV